jgi:hypothetical protein
MQHNEVNDELGDLASKALTPSAVRAGPLISKGSTADEATASATKPPSHQSNVSHPNSQKGDVNRGDLLLLGFFARSTDTIVDVLITDMDAKSHCSKDPHKVLAGQERQKKA